MEHNSNMTEDDWWHKNAHQDEQFECFSTRVQFRNQFCLSAVSLDKGTGVMIVQTLEQHCSSWQDPDETSPHTAGKREFLDRSSAQELEVPMGPRMLEDAEEPMLVRFATFKDFGTPDTLHHIENKLFFNFSSNTVHGWWRPSADSGEQPLLLEPSTRRWCRIPRRWTCFSRCRSKQLISDLSTCVKERAQRSDDSIFLRHMEGTAPEEHVRSNYKHVKTNLYLTDVVVLRHEGDTVNFWGVWNTDLVQSFLNWWSSRHDI